VLCHAREGAADTHTHGHRHMRAVCGSMRTHKCTRKTHTNKKIRNAVCGRAVCADCGSTHTHCVPWARCLCSLWEHTHTKGAHTHKQTQTPRTHAQTHTHGTQSAGALSECSIRNDNNKRLISENGTDSQKFSLYWHSQKFSVYWHSRVHVLRLRCTWIYVYYTYTCRSPMYIILYMYIHMDQVPLVHE
jgi:hypothetical protein